MLSHVVVGSILSLLTPPPPLPPSAFCTYGSFWMGLSLFTILNAAGVWSGASSTGVAAPYS
jgi:hypothetical protein